MNAPTLTSCSSVLRTPRSRRAMTGAVSCALLLGAAFAATAMPACTKEAPAEAPKDTAKTDGAAPTTGATSKPAEAQAAVSNPLCVGRAAVEPEVKLTIAGKAYTQKGSTLSLDAPDADDEFAIGQISDVKDHNPDNAANIKLAMEWMRAEKVDAIAVTGDLGESAESIERVLRDVATVGVPVLAIIGNRECRDDYVKGVAAAQKDLPNVINMNAVRVFNTDDVSFVSMPGYYNRSYIHCAEGCEYTADDIKALPVLAQGATAPVRVLISHGPPLMAGDKAIDRIHEGANVGDPSLAELLRQNGALFPFGIFGNIQEAGGYATDLSGQTRVAAETYADTFYLNPGPIDSVRWAMLDKSESVGMAAIVKIKGKQASYKIYRVKPGEAQALMANTKAPGDKGGAQTPDGKPK